MDWLKDLIQKATQVITTPVNIAKQSLQQQGITTPKQFFDKAIIGGLKEFPSFVEKSLSSPQVSSGLSKIITTGLSGLPGFYTLQSPFFRRDIEKYVENRYVKPVLNTPISFWKMVSPKSTFKERVKGAFGTAVGLATLYPDMFQDVGIPLADLIKGAKAYQLENKGKKMGFFEPLVKGGIPAMTLEKPVGLGEALTTNPQGQFFGNLLEFPIVLGVARRINKIPLKQIKNVDDLASVVSKEFKVGAGEGLTKGLDEVISSLKSKGYQIADDLVRKINKGGVLFGKNFSLSVERPLGQGKAIVDFIFEEGYKPIKQAIEKVKGVKLKPSETFRDLIKEPLSKATSAEEASKNLSVVLDNKINEITKLPEKEAVSKLKSLRASLNKYINEAIGTTGNWKMDYYIRNIEVFENPDNLHLKTMSDYIDEIDDLIVNRQPKKISIEETIENLKTQRQIEQEMGKIKKELEKPVSSGVKIKPPKKPVEIKGLLPGEIEPLTPKQAVSIYKKTGEVYPFKNVLKQADEVIQLPEKSSMLESMVERKGEIFSADDINPNAKDLSDGLLGNIKEAANSVRRMFEGLGEKARKFVVDFHAQKIAEARNFLDEKVKELQKVFDDMGIKGKKQEELLFDYAEGKIPKEQAPENIVIAGQKLRQFYDDLLNKINEKRTLVGADPIARRENYVTHIFELTNDTKKLMDVDPFAKEVVGDVPFFRFGKRRTAEGGYEKDLIKAIRAYVRAAGYQIAMPEVINRWKIMGEALQKKGLTNFANYVARLTEYIQKGATPMVLKMNEQPLLRNLNKVAEIVSSRISKNLISHNISTSFSNPTQIVTNLAPQVGVGNVVKGLAKTIKEGDDLTSVFIRNRREITQLNEGGIEKLLKKIEFFRMFTEFSDRWAYNSALEWALSQGKRLDEAKEIADNMAAKTIGERVFGLVPEYQRYSGVFRLLTMFTLEPINAIYSFFKDIPQTSKNAFDLAVKMGMALVMANLYNQLTERTIGRRFAFDPIDMAVRSIDIWANKPYTTGEKIKETGKTIARNIPLLDVAFGKGAGFLPVSAPIPTEQELTEDLPMAVAKAGLLLANPYGGGYQIYKTLEGLRAYRRGAVETPKGEIKYLVERDLDDFLKTTLFGKVSIPQAREFYEEKRKPLSPQQSMAVKSLESDEDRQKLYDALMYYRAVNGELSTIKTKISEALYLGKKTPQEIKKMANDLYNQAKKNLAYYTDYYKQKKGVYKRVLDFFAKIIKRDTEETPIAKKEKPETTALSEFQGVDLSKILGALGGAPAGTGGVRLSSKSVSKINLPKVSWGKALPKASSKRGGVYLKPVSTTYSRGKEVSKDYTTRRVGRGVRIRMG